MNATADREARVAAYAARVAGGGGVFEPPPDRKERSAREPAAVAPPPPPPAARPPADPGPLTARQRQVLAAIVRHLGEHQRPPSVRELMAITGVRSPNGVACHLRALDRKGLIRAGGGTSRAIAVPGLAPLLAAAADEYLRGLSGGGNPSPLPRGEREVLTPIDAG